MNNNTAILGLLIICCAIAIWMFTLSIQYLISRLEILIAKSSTAKQPAGLIDTAIELPEAPKETRRCNEKLALAESLNKGIIDQAAYNLELAKLKTVFSLEDELEQYHQEMSALLDREVSMIAEKYNHERIMATEQANFEEQRYRRQLLIKIPSGVLAISVTIVMFLVEKLHRLESIEFLNMSWIFFTASIMLSVIVLFVYARSLEVSMDECGFESNMELERDHRNYNIYDQTVERLELASILSLTLGLYFFWVFFSTNFL